MATSKKSGTTATKKKTKTTTPKRKIAKKKTVSKPKTKPKAIEQSTLIKKLFDKVPLLSHPITPHDQHPTKFKKENKSVSSINGIGGSTYFKFESAGIRTIEQFVDAGVSKICSVLGWSEKGGLPVYLRGLALHQNRIIKIKERKNISDTPIYLDIETDDFIGNVIWMIGIYISKTKEFFQLVANTPKDEPKIIKQCLEILSEHPNEQIISYSGSRFDERILRKRFDGENLKHSHLIFDDIQIDLKASYALPISTFEIGDVGEYFGYKFKHPNMDGGEVARIYMIYSSNLTRFGGYKKLLEYNEDDVKSLASIVEHIYRN